MNKQKFMKWALPALLMSALFFEAMPGSVRSYAAIPTTMYHFFNLDMNHLAASCLSFAGIATAVTVILALVAAFSKKHPIFKAVSWCSLAAASLTAAPYFVHSDGLVLQPNVIITLILTACWLIALRLDKTANAETAKKENHPRL